MLEKVISGGQTGADQAGLAAAKHCKIQTGGFAPKGWKTLDGSQPKLKDYGLIEHESKDYKERTWANVNAADATIRFATNWTSAGERCTINAIKKYGKASLDVELPIPDEKREYLVKTVANWLFRHKVKILNIAGNSEVTSPGIYKTVSQFLVEVFKELETYVKE